MVGLVLVSHSKALALALKDMLDRLYAGKVPVAVAAGAGDDGAELGTDATAIVSAVTNLDAPGGVLVLLDLGSAVMSAELALEFLDEETRTRVALCAAPLVEGAVTAAAQCGVGASLADVRAEAERALLQKQQGIGGDALAADALPPAVSVAGETLDLTVHNPHGLHARPAMRIVQTAAGFQSQVWIENLRTGTPAASARSVVSINCLDARHGDVIRVTAQGEDASAALAALVALSADNFGDNMQEPATSAPVASVPTPDLSPARAGTIRGRALSDGVAVGRLVFADRAAPVLPEPSSPVDPATETARLDAALAAVQRTLDVQAATLRVQVGGEHAAILEAHRMLAADPALIGAAKTLVSNECLPAPHAWQRAVNEVAALYRGLPDPVLRERARDVEDLGLQVLQALGVGSTLRLDLSGDGALLVVPTLLPSELANLDLGRVRGVIAETLGQTSHAAILLRAAGVPAVEEVTAQRLREAGITDGQAAVDGTAGEVWLVPDAQADAVLQQRLAAQDAGTVAEDVSLPELRTQDGQRIELAANVGGVADAAAARKYQAEAIGLLRTEFLFLERTSEPSEQTQFETLRAISDAFAPDRPLTVRTLDIGGDKPVPYLPTTPEANPFLGVRGLRLTLRHEALFLTHLRAILRGGDNRHFRVMFPMVTDVAEVRAARALLSRAHEELTREGQPHAWPVEVGMMIEVPAAALNAARFASEVDFFSVGTNDLTQYTLAAERGHADLPDMADALHPAVLRLIGEVANAARAQGIWAGVCGEAAADPVAAAVFVGLGITELSVGAGALPKIRRVVSGLDGSKGRSLAGRAQELTTAEEVRRLYVSS